MWLVFAMGSKKYLIEFKGDETIAQVCKILSEAHGLPSSLLLSFRNMPLTSNHMGARLQDIDNLKDMSEISISVATASGQLVRHNAGIVEAKDQIEVPEKPRRQFWSDMNVQQLTGILGVSANDAQVGLMMANDNPERAASLLMDARRVIMDAKASYDSFTQEEQDAIERLMDTGKFLLDIIQAFVNAGKREDVARANLA